MAKRIPPFDIPYEPDCDWCTPALFPCTRQSTPESLEEGALICDLIGAGLHVHNDRPIGQRWPDVVLPIRSVIVEYDSFIYHSDPKDVREDREKQRVWEAAGYHVFRVREHGLGQARPWDILLPNRSYRRLPAVVQAHFVTQIASILGSRPPMSASVAASPRAPGRSPGRAGPQTGLARLIGCNGCVPSDACVVVFSDDRSR